jgi:hypothetical protein
MVAKVSSEKEENTNDEEKAPCGNHVVCGGGPVGMGSGLPPCV